MYMFKYIMKRLGLLLMTFVIIEVVCFVLIKALPIVIDVQIGKDAELIRMKLEARGYFDPIPVQFVTYIKRIFLEGDFGICVNLPQYRDPRSSRDVPSSIPAGPRRTRFSSVSMDR